MTRSEVHSFGDAMVVRGLQVTDPAVLAQLNLSPDEAAILIEPDVLRRAVMNLNQMERTGEEPRPEITEVQ